MLDRYIHRFEPPTKEDKPVLVLLHGTGGDETSFAQIGRLIDPDAGILSLRGDVDEFGHARFFRRKAEGVYDMEDLAARTEALAGFLDAAIADYGIDRDRAVGIGFSNGANILANLLFVRPEAIRRAALMHPLIPFEPAPQPGLAGSRIVITSGARDPISPPALTARLVDWLAAQGADIRHFEHGGGHEMIPDELPAVASLLVPGAASRAA